MGFYLDYINSTVKDIKQYKTIYKKLDVDIGNIRLILNGGNNHYHSLRPLLKKILIEGGYIDNLGKNILINKKTNIFHQNIDLLDANFKFENTVYTDNQQISKPDSIDIKNKDYHKAERTKYYFSEDNLYVYRGDTRTPKEIIAYGGFSPRELIKNPKEFSPEKIYRHLSTADNKKAVSATLNKKVAEHFKNRNNEDGFLYRLRLKKYKGICITEFNPIFHPDNKGEVLIISNVDCKYIEYFDEETNKFKPLT